MALAAVVGLRWYQNRPIAPIGPGDQSSEPLPIRFFAQTDPRWNERCLGSSQDRIGGSGCTLCCVAMALSAVSIDLPPDILNDRISAAGGYTPGGLIIWDKARFDGGFRIAPAPNRHATIAANLGLKRPVLAKVMIMEGIVHWVLIIGIDHGRYLIADPLDRALKPKYLEAISDGIYALRELRQD